jgi:regulatory protein
MAGKITKLEFQKKNPDRVSVFLDGRFAFGLPAIVAARLKRDQFLSDAEIESLQAEDAIETAYGKALNYLSYRPRSRAEVNRYLEKRDLSESQIEAVAERLERAGLLDDAAFARYWVENRERNQPKGPRALRYELRNKGISSKMIDRALVSVDVQDSAYRSAARKAQQLAHLDQGTFTKKIIQYLARRGFDYEVARETAAHHWSELAAED